MIIKSVEEKTWNDKVFHIVYIEGDDKEYTCWNASVKDWKPGDDVEADISEKNTERGKKYYIKAKGDTKTFKPGGGRPAAPRKTPTEMALNCATAMACKMLEGGTYTPKDAMAALNYLYANIKEMIAGDLN